ncbi:hypothetical protein ACJ6WF_32765 [Streptomyces sp. MMS24-I2-30]|uniref:hypothetical protein n=1 Tax=Streptomyces sp. MMS24-I2-30 TaxID=3351564 RepID=UPI003896E450
MSAENTTDVPARPPAARPERTRPPSTPTRLFRLLAPVLVPAAALARRPGTPGTATAGDGSTTSRELALRRRLLLVLSAAVSVALFFSYQGVHGDADPLRTASGPAVLAIDTAQHALTEAQTTAASPATSEFQKQISVAVQSLAVAASEGAGGTTGRQALQTVAGLITVYAGMVGKAQFEPADSVLRRAYLGYATSILADKDSGITARLGLLQAEQRRVVRQQTSFGRLLWLGWSVTALLVLALAAALAETQVFLRGRFRRRYNRRLLTAAAVLLGGFVTLTLFTLWTHQGMADTRGLLDRPLSGQAITDAGRRTASYLANTGFRAAAAVWIAIGGIVLMALAEAGLRPHINDYRFRPR